MFKTLNPMNLQISEQLTRVQTLGHIPKITQSVLFGKPTK